MRPIVAEKKKRKTKKTHRAKNCDFFSSFRSPSTLSFITTSERYLSDGMISLSLCGSLIYMSLCWARSFFSFPIFVRQASRSSSSYSLCNSVALFLSPSVHVTLFLFDSPVIGKGRGRGRSFVSITRHLASICPPPSS